MKKYAISDIHGCNKTFRALLQKLDLKKTDELYLLGDYIDRGPDSKGVIDTIFQLKEAGHQVTCLRGNHEEYMVRSVYENDSYSSWLSWGGRETIRSFGVKDLGQIPDKYWTFLTSLKHYTEVDRYILVHAGLNFYENNPYEDKHAMIWIRNWHTAIDEEWLGDRMIIHGHTPVEKERIEAGVDLLPEFRYLDIDAGCFNFGWLCALELTSQTLYFQRRLDQITYRS